MGSLGRGPIGALGAAIHLIFHDLRHGATSQLFEKGLNPMEVAAITGHKTLQMLKRYTHLRAEDLVGRRYGLDLDSEDLSDVVALVLDLPCRVYGMGHGRLGRPARITVCFDRRAARCRDGLGVLVWSVIRRTTLGASLRK